MPRFYPPSNSTQHRVAAIALYRALLSGCSSAPLRNEDRLSLHNAIRNKFRKSRHVQSSYQLGLSFRAGYETLDYLDASIVGDTASVKTLAQLISRLPRGLTQKSKPRPQLLTDPPEERLACLPSDRAVLNVRPYATVSGPRHVPIMASANGVPFLRLTKPQPPALSRILRQRLEHKQSLFNSKVMLANWWLPMAKQEDEWDRQLEQRAGVKTDSNGGVDRVQWVDAVKLSEKANQEAYQRDLAKDKAVKGKMQKIVDLETELALKEGQTIVRGRRTRPIRVIKPPSQCK